MNQSLGTPQKAPEFFRTGCLYGVPSASLLTEGGIFRAMKTVQAGLYVAEMQRLWAGGQCDSGGVLGDG